MSDKVLKQLTEELPVMAMVAESAGLRFIAYLIRMAALEATERQERK